MIEIVDKACCTGCGACYTACPCNAIEMKEDEEGVVYPNVIEDKCTNCHKCELICPIINRDNKLLNFEDGKPVFFAARLKDEDECFEVSSGGAFWALAKSTLECGGVVYGAYQTNVDDVYHIRCINIVEAEKVRRSKYLQSNTSDIYVSVKEDLENGLDVLFSGTGCQIAGLVMYLGKKYDNLCTVEVVCHGVPCRLAWDSYRKEKEELEGKKICDIVFRDKSRGWNYNQYKITYEDGKIEYQKSTEQLFHKGYLMGLFYRPSCGKCRFASIPRVADITLADYWKYKGDIAHVNGISLITVNNHKGYNFFEKSKKYLDIESATEEDALASCRHLNNTPIENLNRNKFMTLLKKNGYHKAAKKYIEASGFVGKLLQKLRWIFHGKN
ncbi:MAG: Coenzyme F420 hydrogenase/dehydrogenase, beta subunit C-terminal domain [Lachnospiraceae bacterium]|nr:Coenzyme F420 hydrogenase/dehydrogenase, beta subunit C-terminal domain [Lachnospiraceae bacterium]